MTTDTREQLVVINQDSACGCGCCGCGCGGAECGASASAPDVAVESTDITGDCDCCE